MRLIDADAFKEYMRKALEETRGWYPDKGEWAEAITEQFCEDIDEQPTVEPQQTCEYWDSESKFCALCRPAAQPEKRTEERTETHACDLVDRQAAIERATKDHDFFKGATIPTDKARRDELLNVMCWLRELPSAQPDFDTITKIDKAYDDGYKQGYLQGKADYERKKGKWIEDAETYYKAVNEKGGGVNENTPYFTDDIACSECLAKFSVIDNETERFDFCPNCGSYNGG